MLGLVGFIAIFIVTYQVYKTAKSTERNPWLWSGLAAAAGIGLQIVLPVVFAIALTIYYMMTGTPADRLEQAISGTVTLFSFVSLVASLVGMYLIMKHVSKVKDDEPNSPVQQPPPPPTFRTGV